jgi:hypothetical protein
MAIRRSCITDRGDCSRAELLAAVAIGGGSGAPDVFTGGNVYATRATP